MLCWQRNQIFFRRR